MTLFRSLLIALLLAMLIGCQGSPFKKTIPPEKSKASFIQAYSSGVTLIIIRPYDYGYFMHPTQVFIGTESKPTPYNSQNKISYWKTAKLPNQSYQVVYTAPGTIKVEGRMSSLLGPVVQHITVSGKKGDVIYVVWNTKDRHFSTGGRGYTTYDFSWITVNKEEAEPLLLQVEHIATYYLIDGRVLRVKEAGQ